MRAISKASEGVFPTGAAVRTTLINVLDPEIDKNDRGTKTISVINSDDFWRGLTGIGPYHQGLRTRDSEFNQADQEFVDREFATLDGGRTEYFGPGSESALQSLHDWVASPDFQANTGIVITGERGSGKSWLLKRLWDEVLTRYNEDPSRRTAIAYVPLKLYSSYLRERQGLRRTLAHYLYEKEYFQPPAGVWMLEALITAGRVVLLLDGWMN